jgi:hypothetical protein
MTVGILGDGRGFWEDVKPCKKADTVIEVEIVDMGKPLFAQKLQNQIAQQIGNPRDLLGAIEGAFLKKPVNAQFTNQGDKQENASVFCRELIALGKASDIGHLGWLSSALEGFPPFSPGSAKELRKPLFLQQNVNGLQGDLLPFPVERLLDFFDRVVSLS